MKKAFLFLAGLYLSQYCFGFGDFIAGPQPPGVQANDPTVGTIDWGLGSGNETFLSDDVKASVTVTNGTQTHYLYLTSFGFSIPSAATITGIRAEVEKMDGNSQTNTTDTNVRLIKGGVIGSTNKPSATQWPTADAYTSYAGSGDLWSTTWLYSDINATNFGFVISATCNGGLGDCIPRVDHVRITIYYNVPVKKGLFQTQDIFD